MASEMTCETLEFDGMIVYAGNSADKLSSMRIALAGYAALSDVEESSSKKKPVQAG